MPKTDQHSRQVWEDFWEQGAIEDKYPTSERIVTQISNVIDVNGKWVMEVGAGSGRDGFRLFDMGARVIMLDYAESSLKVIRELSRRFGKPVHLVRGDAFRLPFKSNSIDVIYHQGLLEHFTEPDGILRENHRVMSVGGFTVADVPQRYHLYTAVKHILIWMNKWFAGWETEFSIRQLEGMFRGVGFEVHSAYGDWMRPSFIYRAGREALKKIGIKLPLYPGRVPILSNLRDRLRSGFKKTRLSFYTVMDIGVVGTKRSAST